MDIYRKVAFFRTRVHPKKQVVSKYHERRRVKPESKPSSNVTSVSIEPNKEISGGRIGHIDKLSGAKSITSTSVPIVKDPMVYDNRDSVSEQKVKFNSSITSETKANIRGSKCINFKSRVMINPINKTNANTMMGAGILDVFPNTKKTNDENIRLIV
jgi:hypothetical protein